MFLIGLKNQVCLQLHSINGLPAVKWNSILIIFTLKIDQKYNCLVTNQNLDQTVHCFYSCSHLAASWILRFITTLQYFPLIFICSIIPFHSSVTVQSHLTNKISLSKHHRLTMLQNNDKKITHVFWNQMHFLVSISLKGNSVFSQLFNLFCISLQWNRDEKTNLVFKKHK